MGYYITIVENNLKSRKDISQELKKAFNKDEFYINWQWANGYVGLDEYYFKWSSGFVKDLMILKDLKSGDTAQPTERRANTTSMP